MPSLIDTVTHDAIAPDEVIVYYKSGYGGVPAANISTLPQGLRMVAGNMAATAHQPHTKWECEDVGYSPSTEDFIHGCAPGDRVVMKLDFPQCWDGVNLDSADHKSHMAYTTGSGCPATHPVAIPVITYNVYTVVGPAQDPTTWRLSSDNYDVAEPGGYSVHGDWFNGWIPEVSDTFINNCVRPARDCHGHLLGDGTTLF